MNVKKINVSNATFLDGDVITLADEHSWKCLEIQRDGWTAKYGIGAGVSDIKTPSIINVNPQEQEISRWDFADNSLRQKVDKSNPDKSNWTGYYVDGKRVGFVGRVSGSSNDFGITNEMKKGSLYFKSSYDGALKLDENGHFKPENPNMPLQLGDNANRWLSTHSYVLSNLSDIRAKENIRYLDEKLKIDNISPSDLYNFVKTDLKLAQYDYSIFNTIEDSECRRVGVDKIGFIAQDVKNTKVGSILVKGEPKTAESALTYDLTDYVNILAGALQESILKIEKLEKEVAGLKQPLTI